MRKQRTRAASNTGNNAPTEPGPAAARIRRAHLIVTGGLIAVIGCAYLTTVLLTLADLPPTMATHFGLDGAADDFMTTSVALVFQGLIVLGVPLLLLVTLSVGGWWRGANARSLSAGLTGLAAWLCGLFISTTVAHVGTTDPRQVTLTAGDWLLPLAAGLIIGTIVYLLLPRPLPKPALRTVSPSPLPLAAGSRWTGRAEPSQRGYYLLSGLVVAVIAIALITGSRLSWLAVALVAIVLPASLSFEVIVDSSGLTWRSPIGFPRGHIALADIEQATVINVAPLDFGGWGLRAAPGQLGLITRVGPGLLVRQARREFIATVDDAETAAALIEGFRVGRVSPPPLDGSPP